MSPSSTDSRRVALPLPREPRVLVPIIAGIGNALMAAPFVRRLKRRIPDAHVTVLARLDPMAEVYRRMAEVDETVVTGWNARGLLKMIAETRRRKPDLFIVPFPSNRWQYSVLAAASRAKRAVLHGYPVAYWQAMHFVGTRVPAVRQIHDVEQNLRLLTALGLDPGAPEAPVFPVTEDDRARGAAMLEAAGVGADQPFVAIHAGSGPSILAMAKRWPTAKYAELIGAIRRAFDLPAVLLEGPDEAGVADEIIAAGAGAFGARGLRLKGPLGGSAAVLERSTLYAGSDSGMAHLAAAVGRRCVTIFSPADPDRVCPYGNRDLVVQPPPPCGPCFLYPFESPRPKMRCREPMCIQKVQVETVMEAVRRAMAAAPVTVPKRNETAAPALSSTGEAMS